MYAIASTSLIDIRASLSAAAMAVGYCQISILSQCQDSSQLMVSKAKGTYHACGVPLLRPERMYTTIFCIDMMLLDHLRREDLSVRGDYGAARVIG